MCIRDRLSVAALFFALFLTEGAVAQDDFAITGTYQIEKGQRHGWLILNVTIPEGHHIYALTQKGTPPPTKIKLADSKQFKLIKKFTSNKKPKVIEHDPIFKQRMEEYEGKVALMAPISVAEGVDLDSVAFDLKITGQVCSDSGCMPFTDKAIEITFAGYYEKENKEEGK